MSCRYGCGGLRHKPAAGGGMVRCECLLEEERDARCRAAGIPEAYWHPRLPDLLADTASVKTAKLGLLALGEEVREQGTARARHTMIRAPGTTARILLYLAVKYVLARREARVIGLDELVTLMIKDRDAFNAVRDAPFLGLHCGDEYTQPIHTHLAGALAHYRLEPRFTTLWATPAPTPLLQQKYGTWQGQGALAPWEDPARTITVTEEVRI